MPRPGLDHPRKPAMRTPLTTTIAIGAMLLGLPTLGAVAAVQDAGKSTTSDGGGDLDEQIKAGVMLGMIERSDARDLAKAIMELEGEKAPRSSNGGEKNGGAAEETKPMPAWEVFALPGGGSLTTLLEPEYLPRDASFLADELAIAGGSSAIVETLLDDYANRFDLERRAVFEALADARRASAANRPEITAALDAIADAIIDRDAALDNLRGGGAGKDGGGADPATMEKWIDWAVIQAEGLQRRVVALQVDRPPASSSTPSPDRASAAALGRVMAFRSSREALRRSLEEDLAAIVPTAQKDTLNSTLARLRTEHGRRNGRFGGDSVDLKAAWRAAASELPVDEASTRSGQKAVDDRASELAALVDARTLARINTELAALRGYLDAMAGDQRGVDRAARALEDAADLQVSAEIAVRDLTLAIAQTMIESVETDSPAFGERLRAEIRSRAFRQQMRPRWSEKAIEVTLGLEDLTDDQRAAVLSLVEYFGPQLDRIRDRAIEERLRREVRIARAMAESIVDEYASAKSMDEETWVEPERDAFERIDAEVGTALRQLLTPDQLERLPGHPSIGTQVDPKQDPKRASGKNAGTGSKGASGKGRE